MALKRKRPPGQSREKAMLNRARPIPETKRWEWDSVADELRSSCPDFPIAAEVAYRIAAHHREARLPLGWESVTVAS